MTAHRNPEMPVAPDGALRHVYVHVPFCDGKCDYCAFFSVRGSPDQHREYVDAVVEELRLRRGAKGVTHTLYLGGGTPSVLGAETLGRLCRGLRSALAFGDDMEWTVEVNPRSFDDEVAGVLAAAGVNRISIGAQSLNEEELEVANRRHDVGAVTRAIEAAVGAGIGNVGLDLIAGLPQQSDAGWEATVRQAAALPVRHLSVYALGIEPETPFGRRFSRTPPCTDDALMARLAQAEAILGAHDFERYEISNYARPGCACRHNLAYWSGGDFVGLGPAAASREGRTRRTNAADLVAYLAALGAGTAPPASVDSLTPFDDAEERVLYALRTSQGLDLDAALRRWSVLQPVRGEWDAALERMRVRGWLRRDGRRWILTASGREYADGVIRELVRG